MPLAGQKKKGKHRLAAAVTLRRGQQHLERTAQTGCYVLCTSHAAWDTERIVQTYWQLADSAVTFRSLKSEARLRPVYHRKPERVRGHLFIAVLAYHAIHLLLRRRRSRRRWANGRGCTGGACAFPRGRWARHRGPSVQGNAILRAEDPCGGITATVRS